MSKVTELPWHGALWTVSSLAVGFPGSSCWESSTGILRVPFLPAFLPSFLPTFLPSFLSFFLSLLPFPSFFLKLLALLSLHCCTQAFSSCNQRGLLFVVVHGLSLPWLGFSFCREQTLGHGLQKLRLTGLRHVESSLTSDWTLSPHIGGQILIPVSSGKSLFFFFFFFF